MAENFIEDLMYEYYKMQGYFVMQNYWFDFNSIRKRSQRGKSQEYTAKIWSNIDILSINETELNIVQVKAIINDKKSAEDITEYFDRVKEYLEKAIALDNKSSINWWKKEKKINFIVIYEYYSSPSYIEILKKKEIIVIDFKEKYKNIKEYINNKVGSKEEKSIVRFMHFLKQNES
ncbi:hypothetical protein [Alkalispirochaeta alkalica]|uniref:hypothetical protein n=1 Tax=Alkalispirochaeta alkalica TaxID=46356 RepID=UPI000366FD52|nr:hypothetical protein [Alkalispirochaeta alkalica]